jgi:hypothetical protein
MLSLPKVRRLAQVSAHRECADVIGVCKTP